MRVRSQLDALEGLGLGGRRRRPPTRRRSSTRRRGAAAPRGRTVSEPELDGQPRSAAKLELRASADLGAGVPQGRPWARGRAAPSRISATLFSGGRRARPRCVVDALHGSLGSGDRARSRPVYASGGRRVDGNSAICPWPGRATGLRRVFGPNGFTTRDGVVRTWPSPRSSEYGSRRPQARRGLGYDKERPRRRSRSAARGADGVQDRLAVVDHDLPAQVVGPPRGPPPRRAAGPPCGEATRRAPAGPGC